MSNHGSLNATDQAHENLLAGRVRAGQPRFGALLFALVSVAPAVGCAIAAGDAKVEAHRDDAISGSLLPPVFKPPPRPLLDPEMLVEISAGGDHTCVRKLNGNLYCWGLNHMGQTGVSNTTCSGLSCATRPLLVASATQQVELGYDHTCMLDSTGQAFCWGDGNSGQLGNGVSGPSWGAPIADLSGTPILFSKISAGTASTCGVAAGTGNVFCWGVVMQKPYVAYSPSPVVLRNQGGIVLDMMTSVTVGTTRGCIQWTLTNGLGTENECWSSNDSNGFSDLSWAFSNLATRVVMQSDFVCAEQTDGTVQCAGADYYGQLGDGVSHVAPNWTPQVVGGGMQLRSVTAGQDHTCALDTSGNAYCWGHGEWNQVGATGIGSAPPVFNPTPVAVLANGVHFRALAAGDQHTCGIGTDNHIYCWGRDEFGQLGIGFTQNIPTAVSQALDPM